jgi:hypothetical protein
MLKITSDRKELIRGFIIGAVEAALLIVLIVMIVGGVKGGL